MAELLAPAGTIEALDAAINEGADAVYMGLKSFNARLRSSNFAWNQFEAAVGAVHRLNKKIFVTVNTVMEERETERMFRFLAWLEKVGPDGIIVQDFGVVKMVKDYFPNLRIHASTQMNIASAKAANTMGRSGLSRVVLARELGLAEIEAIREQTRIELEVFVHGALCVSESGLCLFSSYLGGKSANRGLCTQACRRLYTAEINGVPREGYYFSPYDLQLIDVIPSLIKAGVDSFKIEGRMKSAEYVGCVVSAYRYLMDNWESDPEGAIATAKRKLSSDFAREKTLYWYQKGAPANILNPDQAGGTGLKLGKIKQTRVFKNAEPVEESLDENEPKGADPKATAPFGAAPSGAAPKTTALYASLTGGYTPEPGDSIRLHRKDDTGRESHKIKDVRFADSDSWIDIPSGFSTGDEVYLIQTKTQGKRYQRILPPDLSRFRSHPGAQKVPSLELPRLDKAALDVFPEGLYIQVSTVADMHAVLSAKPTAVILELNSETITSLIENKEILPLQKKQVYISLDPFFPQGDEDRIAGIVDFLIEEGYWHWVVNNPGHLALLRNRKVRTLAGPYLYTFNRWAISWLSSQGITHFITPLENSRQNLERTVDSDRRKQAFVTLFAYPALFRMRFKLPEKYDFLYFSDKQDTVFKAMSTPDGSFVLPENPYSIIDKIGFLQSSGFSHFILDLSKTIVRKNDFRQIMTALEKETMLPDTERFNWKDGFYSPEDMEQRANTAQWLAEKQRGADKSRFTEKPESYGKQRSTDKHWGAGKPRGVGSTQHSGGKSFGAGKSRGSFQKNTDPCNPGGRRTPRNKPK